MSIGPTGVLAATVLGLLVWVACAVAQQPAKVPLIAILSDEGPSLAVTSFEPFAQGLRALGYVEGQNIAFERRSSEGKDEILPGLAAELVRLQPDVILAVGTPAARAAKSASQTLPIVFARTGDPIGSGLVPELARPRGNVTGLSLEHSDVDAKRLELLITAVPSIKRVGVLLDANFPPAGLELREVERAARSLNLELIPEELRGPDDLKSALRAMVEQHVSALLLLPSRVIGESSQQIIDLAIKARFAAMFYTRRLVEAGGLMSYGANYPDMYRRAAAFVDKILRGAKPADLPVEQPTKFELIINLKTAKAIGLTIPSVLLARADEVIE